MHIELVTLDAITLDGDTKAPVIKATQPITDDEDVEAFGDLPLMQCLGVSSAPWGKDENGYCEGAVARGVGGRDGVILGARDTRTNDIVGNLKPGDTVVHTTGPSKAAQLQLKEGKRQAVLVTKGSDGKQIMLLLDGKNDKVTIAAFGMAFQFEKSSKKISMCSANGKNGITIGDDVAHVFGTVVLGGMTPAAGVSLMTGPVTGTPNTSGTPIALVPAKGVFIGL